MRAAAGSPADCQTWYGPAKNASVGRRIRRSTASPVFAGLDRFRVGNAASGQRQLDIYGDLVRRHLRGPPAWARTGWSRPGRDHRGGRLLEKIWREPTNGIWEVRGPRRHFVHSKVMAWVAFDRAIAMAEQLS